MQGLEPGALNFNDAIVQVSCSQGRVERGEETGAADCWVQGCAALPPARPTACQRAHFELPTLLPLQESLANQPTPEMLAEVHSIVQEALAEVPGEAPPPEPPQQQQQQPHAGKLCKWERGLLACKGLASERAKARPVHAGAFSCMV